VTLQYIRALLLYIKTLDTPSRFSDASMQSSSISETNQHVAYLKCPLPEFKTVLSYLYAHTPPDVIKKRGQHVHVLSQLRTITSGKFEPENRNVKALKKLTVSPNQVALFALTSLILAFFCFGSLLCLFFYVCGLRHMCICVHLQTGKTSIIKDLHVSEAEYEVARSRLVSWALANPEGTYPSRSKSKKKKKKKNKHKKKKLSSSSDSESSSDSDSSSSDSEPPSTSHSRKSVSAVPSASSSSEALRLPNASSNSPDFGTLLNRLDRLFKSIFRCMNLSTPF